MKNEDVSKNAFILAGLYNNSLASRYTEKEAGYEEYEKYVSQDAIASNIEAYPQTYYLVRGTEEKGSLGFKINNDSYESKAFDYRTSALKFLSPKATQNILNKITVGSDAFIEEINGVPINVSISKDGKWEDNGYNKNNLRDRDKANFDTVIKYATKEFEQRNNIKTSFKKYNKPNQNIL